MSLCVSNRLNLDVGTVHADVWGHKVDHLYVCISDGCCVMMCFCHQWNKCSPRVPRMSLSAGSLRQSGWQPGAKKNHKSLKISPELGFRQWTAPDQIRTWWDCRCLFLQTRCHDSLLSVGNIQRLLTIRKEQIITGCLLFQNTEGRSDQTR